MSKLQNKVAVVTGGNSGIGYATAKELVAAGATVIITGRNKEALTKAANELKVTAIVSDQSDLKAIDRLVADVTATFGKVDVLFVNAGIGAFIPMEGVDENHFDSIINTNFKGAYFTLQKFIPSLKDGASVIFLSSVSATTGMAGSSVYSASKAALNSVIKVASTELAPRQIRVNGVSPGPIDTPIFTKLGMDDVAIQEFATTMQARIPLKRIGTAEGVAKLVTFLASDDASFITGSEYVIDGGVNVNAILN